MSFAKRPFVLLSIGALFILNAVPAFAANPARNESVARVSGSTSAIEWQPSIDNERLLLTVSGPDARVYVKDFPGGRPVVFRAADLDKLASDGTYIYELRVVPRISADVKRRLAAAREKDDDAEIARIRREAGLGATAVQSGAFTLRGGAFVATEAVEQSLRHTSAGDAAARAPEATPNARFGQPVADDQVIPDDLIVQSSICAGFDCVDGESFGNDTLRLKENVLRIHFEDTSTSGGYPSNNWRLIANDPDVGGANKFSIEDSTSVTVPFTISGGAPTNSMFVDSSGRLGLKTATPGLSLHIAKNDTPAIRLEQDNTGGFTAQTWDVGGNEANFFIRDLTGGSKLSFRIRPGAPTSSIDISSTGQVGIGTAAPTQKLHVMEDTNANTFALVENNNTGLSAAAVLRAKSDTATVNFQAHASTRTVSRFGVALGGYAEMLGVAGKGLVIGTLGGTPLIFGTGATARMTIDGAGNVTVPGNFTVTGVKNFAVADPADAKRALYYTALEGPEAGTYFRGSAKTVNGVAVIELPGYFARLTEAERMTVQLTPVGAWGNLYVESKTPENLVVKTAPGTPDLSFDYLVQGVRRGYLDYQVERTGVFPVN